MKRLDSAAIAEALSERVIRAEVITHLGAMACDDDALPDILAREVMEDEWAHEALGLPYPDHRIEEWEFVEALREKRLFGWLVKFCTPVPLRINEHGGSTYSWGHYTGFWLYGESFEDLCKQAVERVDGWHKRLAESVGDDGKVEPGYPGI